MRESDEIRIKYDGNDLAAGAMDIVDLAPSILGLSDVLSEINRTALQNDATVSLRVKADFKRGSFAVDLEVVLAGHQAFQNLLTSEGASALSNLFSILGVSGIPGVFQLIQIGRGRKPTSVVEIEHTEKVRITFEGDPPIEVYKDALKLLNNGKVREGLERAVKPLKRDGINKIEIKAPRTKGILIDKSEVGYFDTPTEHEDEIVSESTKLMSITSPFFTKNNKWRVSDGSKKYAVSIQDDNFIRSVLASDLRFGAGDCLKVQLRTRQWLEGGKLRITHEILKVLLHIPRNKQQKTLFE